LHGVRRCRPDLHRREGDRGPPHTARRAQAAVDAAGDRLMQAEMLTRSTGAALHGSRRRPSFVRGAA
jgi:hypothetical protein